MLETQWLQVKGDPAIRDRVFEQTRTASNFDLNMDRLLDTVETLIMRRGMFHVIVHFSSNQLTCWSYHDPFRYAVYVGDRVLDSDFIGAFPPTDPWIGASVPDTALRPILSEFKRLRFRDEHVYLRNGSINVINGLIGLSFSCDGTHYMPHQDFCQVIGLI
jgi:hypothetical protein